MEEVSMKLSLTELYQLVGDNKGISFNYETLPGVTVTIGFTSEEEQYDSEEDDGEGTNGKLH